VVKCVNLEKTLWANSINRKKRVEQNEIGKDDLPPLFGPLLMLDWPPETAPGQQSMLLELVADSPVNCAA